MSGRTFRAVASSLAIFAVLCFAFVAGGKVEQSISDRAQPSCATCPETVCHDWPTPPNDAEVMELVRLDEVSDFASEVAEALDRTTEKLERLVGQKNAPNAELSHLPGDTPKPPANPDAGGVVEEKPVAQAKTANPRSCGTASRQAANLEVRKPACPQMPRLTPGCSVQWTSARRN